MQCIFSANASGQVNHAVSIIGWGADYWIIANSWSSQWGFNGYAKVKKGILEIGKNAMFCSVLTS